MTSTQALQWSTSGRKQSVRLTIGGHKWLFVADVRPDTQRWDAMGWCDGVQVFHRDTPSRGTAKQSIRNEVHRLTRQAATDNRERNTR